MSKHPEQEVFCILPWVHLEVLPNGSVLPCSLWPPEASLADLKQGEFEKVWNSKGYQDLRQKMLNGEKISECESCYRLEKCHQVSLRQHSNKKFTSKVSSAKNAHANDLPISYDLRLSNICNFRCRHCELLLSSSWYQDELALNPGAPKYPQKMSISKDAPDFWQEVLKIIPVAEEIYFSGGEPVFMDEHLELLQKLISANRTDVRLIYNTNFSQLNYKGVYLPDLWKNFSDIQLNLSIDDMDERAEYYRKGTQWSALVENYKILKRDLPFANFLIRYSAGIYNIFHLPELFNFLHEEMEIHPDQFHISLITNPGELSLQVLPQTAKKEIALKLKKQIKLWMFQDVKKWQQFIQKIGPMIDYMQAEDHSNLFPQTLQRIRDLDRIRGESFSKIYPDYAQLLGIK